MWQPEGPASVASSNGRPIAKAAALHALSDRIGSEPWMHLDVFIGPTVKTSASCKVASAIGKLRFASAVSAAAVSSEQRAAHSAAHASSSLADCGDGCTYDRTDMPRDAWLRTCMPAH
jgi:hypothetical protein